MKIEFLLALLFLSIVTNQLSGQDVKQEREVYVDKSVFPEAALSQLNQVSEAKQLRYIRETDGTNVSYEAKFIWNKQKLSVEFSPDGTLEDIEVIMQKRDIPQELMGKIDKQFKKLFKKYKITRVQKQYKPKTDNNASVLHFYLQGMLEKFDINYEVKVRVVEKNGQEIGAYEILISDEAQILQKRKFEKVTDDNVVY